MAGGGEDGFVLGADAPAVPGHLEPVDSPGKVLGQLFEDQGKLGVEGILLVVVGRQHGVDPTSPPDRKGDAGREPEAGRMVAPGGQGAHEGGLDDGPPLPEGEGGGGHPRRGPGIDGESQPVEVAGPSPSGQKAEDPLRARTADPDERQSRMVDGKAADLQEELLFVRGFGHGLRRLGQKGPEVRDPLDVPEALVAKPAFPEAHDRQKGRASPRRGRREGLSGKDLPGEIAQEDLAVLFSQGDVAKRGEGAFLARRSGRKALSKDLRGGEIPEILRVISQHLPQGPVGLPDAVLLQKKDAGVGMVDEEGDERGVLRFPVQDLQALDPPGDRQCELGDQVGQRGIHRSGVSMAQGQDRKDAAVDNDGKDREGTEPKAPGPLLPGGIPGGIGQGSVEDRAPLPVTGGRRPLPLGQGRVEDDSRSLEKSRSAG